MTENIFSSLISITAGLHRDKRTDKDFKDDLKKLSCKTVADGEPIFEIEYPRALGNKNKYYKQLIDNCRYTHFNEMLQAFQKDVSIYELEYHYALFYPRFEKTLRQIQEYIIKHDHKISNLTADDTYIIQYLKISAIWLFSELQERYQKYGEEDFLNLKEITAFYFQEPDDAPIWIKKNTTVYKERLTKPQHTPATKTPKEPKALSFGYRKKEIEKLAEVIRQLQVKIDLLDESQTSMSHFTDVLTADDLSKIKEHVFIGCETTQFRAVLDALKPYFRSLTLTNIEKSQLFYTKNLAPLTANNLSRAKIDEVKQQAEINRIVKQLQ